MSSKPELTGAERDAEIERLSQQYPERSPRRVTGRDVLLASANLGRSRPRPSMRERMARRPR